MRWFHGLDAGKTGHFGAEGIRSACAETPEMASRQAATTARRATTSLSVSAQADCALSRALCSRLAFW